LTKKKEGVDAVRKEKGEGRGGPRSGKEFFLGREGPRGVFPKHQPKKRLKIEADQKGGNARRKALPLHET